MKQRKAMTLLTVRKRVAIQKAEGGSPMRAMMMRRRVALAAVTLTDAARAK
jgi:hypothetical protein